MAEQVSREAALIALVSNGSMKAASSGPVRASVITSPSSVTWANGDTIGNRDRIPAGSRLLYAKVSCADMGTSITLDVGVRAWKADGTGAAIDADGVVAALDVATAAVSTISQTGAMVKDGTDTGVLSADAEPYFTLNGGTPTANAQIQVTVFWVGA